MHVCVVGTGASGLMAVAMLAKHPKVDKVTLIGSTDIPPIGVGESTTMTFPAFCKKYGIDLKEFIRESDGAVKYGVLYRNWSNQDFIHHFKGLFSSVNSDEERFNILDRLPNITTGEFIHDYIGSTLWKEGVKNHNVLDTDVDSIHHPMSFHFDAGKFIEFLFKQVMKSDKVHFLEDTVVNVNFSESRYIINLTTKNNTAVNANYYINTTGQNTFSENLFKEEYELYTDILLTNKAVVCPLDYRDKRSEFHPYTVAKTMKNGWRWITPTWSRIGTGYVFSDNHISEDQAISELLSDIGDTSLTPRVVDFTPRANKTTFKLNHCSVGMANSFLEPLDAPGLTLATNLIMYIGEEVLGKHSDIIKTGNLLGLKYNKEYQATLSNLNLHNRQQSDFWKLFIYSQYKHCYRSDTEFWRDCKNVELESYNLFFNSLQTYKETTRIYPDESYMLAQTAASYGKKWRTGNNLPLQKVNDNILPGKKPVHHLDFIKSIRNL